MIQDFDHFPGRQPLPAGQGHSSLRRRYPVLLPVFLLSSSVALGIAGVFAGTLFPVLAFIGAPVGLFCLALACVAGIAGLLTAIIGILESIDRHHLKAAKRLRPKEQRYGN
jgi:hypothetical protein